MQLAAHRLKQTIDVLDKENRGITITRHLDIDPNVIRIDGDALKHDDALEFPITSFQYWMPFDAVSDEKQKAVEQEEVERIEAKQRAADERAERERLANEARNAPKPVKAQKPKPELASDDAESEQPEPPVRRQVKARSARATRTSAAPHPPELASDDAPESVDEE